MGTVYYFWKLHHLYELNAFDKSKTLAKSLLRAENERWSIYGSDIIQKMLQELWARFTFK